MLNRKLTLSLMFAVALVTAGCGNDSSAGQCNSALQIDLSVTNDIEINVEGLELVINEVLYTISGNGLDPAITGSINTSDPESTASVEVFGLLPGDDYLVELEANSEDMQTTCRGSANFDVTAGEPPTEVHVLLRCSVGQRFGAVRANGWFNICAELVEGVVSPLQTSIGNSIIVSSRADDWDDDEGDIEYRWSSENGSFADPSLPATFYTCDKTGGDTLTLVVSDDGFEYCTDSWSVEVECVDENGTGGTGGSGTGGAGGSSTGGSGGNGNGGAGGSATGGSGGNGNGGAGGSATGGSGGNGSGGSGGSATGGSGGNGSGGSGGSATGGRGGSGTGGSGGSATGGRGGAGSGSGTGGTGGNSCQVSLTVN